MDNLTEEDIARKRLFLFDPSVKKLTQIVLSLLAGSAENKEESIKAAKNEIYNLDFALVKMENNMRFMQVTKDEMQLLGRKLLNNTDSLIKENERKEVRLAELKEKRKSLSKTKELVAKIRENISLDQVEKLLNKK